MNSKILRLGGYALLALATGGLMAGLHAGGQFIRKDWLILLVWMVPCMLIVRHLSKQASGGRHTASINQPTGKLETGNWKPELAEMKPAYWLLFALGVYLFSSGASTTFSFFIHWMPTDVTPATLFEAGITWFVLLTGILAVASSLRTWNIERLVLVLLLAAQFMCARELLLFTDGKAIYCDDHSSFMFRLWELANIFPQYRTYNPFWNGGVAEHHVFTSGIALTGVPFIPLIKWLGVEQVYTYIILTVYIVVVPWLAVVALRVMEADRTASYIAGTLMLGATLKFFLWMLHYGTIAANFALPFILLVAACLYRIIVLQKREWWTGVLLVVSSLCLLMWPLAGAAAAAFIPVLLIHARKLNRKTTALLLACGVALVALYSKHIILILFHSNTFEKNFMGVITSEEAKTSFTFSLDIIPAAWKLITDHLREANPLVLFMGMLGIFAYPNKAIRKWFAPAILLIFLLAAFGRSYFPDLQLRRMSIPLVILCVIPTALWASLILRTRTNRTALARGMILTLLILSAWNCSRVYANKSYAPYRTMTPYMQELVAWIEDNVPADSRVLFGGRTVHKYGRAHVAALPLFTGHEMMACDYYAFSPKEVEYEYPPRPFRVEEDGNYRFMQLYNVSHIITHHNNYIRHFTKRPHQYELAFVNEDKNIHVFRVRQELSPLLQGKGEVNATFGHIDVRLSEPMDEVVIKYNWDEGLSVDPPAELFPYEAHEHATLIGIKTHGADDIRIRYKSWL